MPYLQSQHFRSAEHPTYWQASPSASSPETMHGAEDHLTGLPTLREFYRVGPQSVAKCLTAAMPCAIAIFDIGHFRRLSDAHPKEVSAAIVTAVANKLRAVLQGMPHLLARLDEEQFGLLVTGLNAGKATELCDTLRLAIGEMRISAHGTDLSVTVSVGVAEVCGPEAFDNYLNGAEQFLFMAKSYGRNQVFSDHTIELQMAG
jgi:diguanylate cyclase (GGDEF)-like protein